MYQAITRRYREIKQITQDPWLLISLLVVVSFIALFIIYPVFRACVQSFYNTKGEFGLDVYRRLLSREYWVITANTFKMGIGVAVLSTAVGFLFAYTLTRCRVPFSKFFRLCALIPIVSPPFAVAMSIILLFGRNGLITKKLLGIPYDIYGLDGLVLAQVISFFPIAYLMFEGLLQALDPDMEEAALNLGASKGHIFRTITLPLLVPGIAGALLLLFVTSLADLANPVVMGGDFKVLASEAFFSIIGMYDIQKGAALSVVLLIPSLTVFILQRYWVSRKSYISVTGKPSTGRIEVREWYIRYPLILVCLLLSLFILLVYGLIFVGAFSELWGVNYSLTLRHFLDSTWGAFSRGREAMIDTIILAAAATPIAAILGMIIAFLVVRKKFIGKQALDFASMLGMAVPGTVLGIGYIIAFNRRPLLLTGTALIIIIVFAVRSIPTGVRNGIAALYQIDPSIEEASINLGADAQYTFRHVTLPLIRPALLATVIYSFTRHMTSLSAIIFVVSPQWRILTAVILNQLDLGDYGLAAALCTILIVIVMAAIGVLYFVVGWTGRERLVEL